MVGNGWASQATTSWHAAVRAATDGRRGQLCARAVAEGQIVFDAALAQRVLAELRSRTPDDAFPELTSREREVYALLAKGLNNRVIAQRLGVSAKTVANHVSNVFAKLHLADRAEAIIRARDAGLGNT